MIKVTILYGPPTDPAAFEEYYRSTHAPLADKIPGATYEWGKALPGPDGSEPPYFWLATLTFPDAAALGSALSGPEGQAATADVPKFATGGATIVLSEVN